MNNRTVFNVEKFDQIDLMYQDPLAIQIQMDEKEGKPIPSTYKLSEESQETLRKCAEILKQSAKTVQDLEEMMVPKTKQKAPIHDAYNTFGQFGNGQSNQPSQELLNSLGVTGNPYIGYTRKY